MAKKPLFLLALAQLPQDNKPPEKPATMSVTLHTSLGDIKIEVFCESVPKTAEVRNRSFASMLALSVC